MNACPDALHEIVVSVVIASYNRAQYLPEALDSVLNQSRPPKEVIVIDDGSTDNTPEVLDRYEDRIRVFRTENKGKSSALNLAIPESRGTHLWFFDDDDVALPGALQSHVNFLVAHPDVDFSYSPNYRYSGSGDIWQREAWATKTIPDWPPDHFLVCTLREGMHTMLQGMLIPKHCLLEVGPFDESLFRVEDAEMLIRLAYRFRGRNIGVPTFVLRDHAGHRGPGLGVRSNRLRVFKLQYQQRVFRRVRDEYPLSTYLPREPGTTVPDLSQAERGRALIQRSCIVLRQGLVDEALQDLAAGLNQLQRVQIPMDGTGAMLSRAVDIDPRRFKQPFRLVFLLYKTLKANGGDDLVASIGRGVWWSFGRAIRQRLWFEAAVAAGMLCLAVLCNPVAMLRSKGESINYRG